MGWNMEKHQNKYRYERKYNLHCIDYEQLLFLIKSQEMKLHHPSRIVNNIYFDSIDLNAYYENVEGLSNRSKFRLRWYGKRFQKMQPTFEVKIKRESVNIKKSLKLSAIDFFNLEHISTLHSQVEKQLEERNLNLYIEMMNKVPTLLNGYSRDYFISTDNKTRLTIDRNLYFYNCQNHQEYRPEKKMIVEIKYPASHEPTINFNKFNLTLGKSSKYVSGLDYTKF